MENFGPRPVREDGRQLSKTVGAAARGLIEASPYADGVPEAGMQQRFLIQGRQGSAGARARRMMNAQRR
jgi:hypothetical protein